MRKVSGRLVKEIDLTDIPETADWSKAVVGKFYRPVNESLPQGGAAKRRRKQQPKKNSSRDGSKPGCYERGATNPKRV